MGLLPSHEMALERLFVGRAREREAFAVAGAAGAPRVLLVHGPSGIGKTTLLHALALDASRAGRVVVQTRAESLGGSAGAITESLEGMLRSRDGRGLAVLIDGWEQLRAFDELAQAVLLRALSGPTVVVLAGREPPSARMQASEAFGAVFEAIPLRALSHAESHALLGRRGVAPMRQDAIVALCHGHPLALALAADVARRAVVQTEDLASDASFTGALWDHFFGSVPEHARAALEVAALLRSTNEEDLAALAPGHDAHLCFEWLLGSSFAERVPGGLRLHDLARELTLHELRWRSPSRYADLVKRTFAHVTQRLQRRRPDERAAAFLDVVELYEAPGFAVPSCLTFTVSACDGPSFEQVRELVRARDGEEEAARAAHWFRRQPQAFRVVRTTSQRVEAFVANLRVDLTTDDERSPDPVVERTFRWVERQMAGRPMQAVHFARFWQPEEVTHELRGVCGVLKVEPLLLSDEVSFAGARFRARDMPADGAAVAGFSLVPELAHVAAGEEFVVGFYDRRGSTAADWLDFATERALDARLSGAAPPPPPIACLALEREDFARAVRDALRAIGNGPRLERSPLVDARMVLNAARTRATRAERAEVLRTLLLEAMGALQAECGHQAATLRANYVSGAETQERAAESLRLAYGTYRRYLAQGTARVIELLWALDGGAPR